MADVYEPFDTVWNRVEFRFSAPILQPRMCVYAEAFREWVETLYQDIVTTSPTVVAINQAKILLLDRFFVWRSVVPKSHRNRIGENGHTCIFHVFEQGYNHLRTIELSLMPPLLFIPPKPAPPPIPGFYLGDGS